MDLSVDRSRTTGFAPADREPRTGPDYSRTSATVSRRVARWGAVNAAKGKQIASYAMDLMGMGGMVMDHDWAPMRAAFQEALLSSPGSRIAAGTDEILRNVIAERVLGLPQDLRVDRELPFEDLPTSKR
jgi:alkylation response protein AidB-like acyl-CoA dehydrogenase